MSAPFTSAEASVRPAGRPRRGGLRRAPLAVLGVLSMISAALLVPATAGSAGAATSIGNISAAVADDGAKVTAETVVDARTVDLTISSPALGTTTTARLLLPRDWFTSPKLYWPTIYMLDGANEPQDYKSWTAYTDIESFTANANDLLVLPSDGPDGCYTDTYNPLNLPGNPKWETYHTVELQQIVERGYRSNGMKSVAGLSIGGYGALIYSARHPGMFKMAASYSGLTNIFDLSALVSVTGSRLENGQFFGPWGSLLLNHANWVAHNPLDQAAKLKGTQLFISSGDGSPGPLDVGDVTAGRIIETFTVGMNKTFVQRLQQLGVPATVDLYKGGAHTWPYWQRELHTSWPQLAASVGGPTTTPAATAVATKPAATNWWNAFFG